MYLSRFQVRVSLVCVSVILLLAAVVNAQTPPPPPPADQTIESADIERLPIFSKGTQQLAFGAGVLEEHLLVNISWSYYLLERLSLGVAVESWILNSPAAFCLSPEVRYTFGAPGIVNPYVAGVYRHRFSCSRVNYSRWSGRAGLAFQIGDQALAVGVIGVRPARIHAPDGIEYTPEICYWTSF